jgi:hypothetical protein
MRAEAQGALGIKSRRIEVVSLGKIEAPVEKSACGTADCRTAEKDFASSKATEETRGAMTGRAYPATFQMPIQLVEAPSARGV